MTRPARILVVEDEASARDALTALLGEDGWDATPAASGREAIDALRSEDFDAIITDLVMPGTDGLAVLEWIEAHRPETPVLVVSGHADIAKKASVGWRADLRYLEKPVQYQDVADWVSAAVPSPAA